MDVFVTVTGHVLKGGVVSGLMLTHTHTRTHTHFVRLLYCQKFLLLLLSPDIHLIFSPSEAPPLDHVLFLLVL